MSQSHFLWFFQLPPEGSSDDRVDPLQWINKHAHTHFAMIAFCQYLIYLPSWKMAYIPSPSLQLLSFNTESSVRQLRHCFPPYNMYLLSKGHPVPGCAIVEPPRLQRATIFLFQCWWPYRYCRISGGAEQWGRENFLANIQRIGWNAVMRTPWIAKIVPLSGRGGLSLVNHPNTFP